MPKVEWVTVAVTILLLLFVIPWVQGFIASKAG